MGGCVGTQSGGRRNSGSNSGLSDSSLAPVTKNKPLKVFADTLTHSLTIFMQHII